MSKISELLDFHCPNGVEFRQLHEIFEIKKGLKFSSSTESFSTGKTVPWFSLLDIRRNGSILYESEKQVATESVRDLELFPADSIIIARHAKTGTHALVKQPHLLDQNLTSLSVKPEFSQKIDMQFANYYCFILDNWCLAKKSGLNIPSVRMVDFRRFLFPIPPLPVQLAIVSILDKFIALETELEAELKARRQQLDFYVNSLFSFDATCKTAASNTVKWKTLGEVGEFINEQAAIEENFNDNVVAVIHENHMLKLNDIFAFPTKEMVSASPSQNFKKVRKGDVIIMKNGTTAGEICKAVAWMGNCEAAVDHKAFVYRHTLHPNFAAYFFNSNQFRKQIMPYFNGRPHRLLSIDSLNRVKVPVPPIEEQKRIATILDKLSSLVNDSDCGLSVEISARRKQHKHYLSKILKFKEAT